MLDINDIPRGQLSTIILTSLLNGDKYGYEIINEVETKTNGELIIKKPSLYSALSRMENQDLVSSYWKDSDIGGKRHYYRLTDFGRKQVLQWQEDLINSQNKVSRILSEQKTEQSQITTTTDTFKDDNKATVAHQENLFAALNSNNFKQENSNPTLPKKDIFLQYDLFDSNFISTPAVDDYKVAAQEQQVSVFNMASFSNEDQSSNKINLTQEPKKDDAVLLESEVSIRLEDKIDNTQNHNSTTPKVEQGNFEIEQEFSKYKKVLKSYAEDISTNDVKSYTTYDYVSPSHNTNYFGQNLQEENLEIHDESQKTELNQEAEDLPKTQEVKSDAVFITDVLNEEDFKVKKIEPASFVHLDSPAVLKPKQTINEQVQEKQSVTNTYFEDYNSLKNYFNQMNIKLKVYGEKQEISNKENLININAYKFYSYLIFFVLTVLEIGISFLVLNFTSILISNHLYYLIAYLVVAFIPFCYYSYKFIKNPKKMVDKSAVSINSVWFKLCLLILAMGIIYCVNSIFGMNFTNFKYYLSTSVVPLLILSNCLFVHIYKYITLKKDKKEK